MRWLVAWLVLGLRLTCALKQPFAKLQGTHKRVLPLRNSAVGSTVDVTLGGKIVVSGLNGGGQSTEDEFMLNLLNEQSVWSSVVLATPEETSVAQKRFLTRTARYSGLLNILEFAKVDVSADEQLGAVLTNANAWLAFNVSQNMVPRLSQQALAAGVKRFVVTVALPADKVKETSIPEFDAAVADFAKAGASFTGIRHGAIIEGDENKPYEIYNATIPCLEDTVEQGVLARVTAELLLVPGAANSQCGVSSSSAFAQAYLNILRSSGLTRRQEVTKLFEGGLQKVAQLTVAEYEAEAKRKEARKVAAEERKAQEEKEEALSKARAAQEAMNALPASTGIKKVTRTDPNASITPHWDEDQEPAAPTDEEKIVARTDEILKNVWREFETRMYAKSTSKGEFYDSNRATARELAEKEVLEAKAKELSETDEKAAKQQMLDRLVDVNRKQYNKLLALERKEMQNQKDISDTWVRYIYLLLESTMRSCKQKDVLFHNLDQFGQTVLLRDVANDLRAQCGLPAFDVVYDPLDASVIVGKLSESPLGKELNLGGDIDTTMAALAAKYDTVMTAVPALRGASQIVKVAVETLKKELPPAPPTVNDIRRDESKAKREAISAGRLDSIKNRGKPSADGGSAVGRL